MLNLWRKFLNISCLYFDIFNFCIGYLKPISIIVHLYLFDFGCSILNMWYIKILKCGRNNWKERSHWINISLSFSSRGWPRNIKNSFFSNAVWFFTYIMNKLHSFSFYVIFPAVILNLRVKNSKTKFKSFLNNKGDF